MGNQLTGIAPSQILPVEHYLQDLPQYEYESSLGSTRFLKVAKATNAEGCVVAKVFVIHDPSLPLDSYKKQLHEIRDRLLHASNVLPYQKTELNDKAALLIRMYVKDSLYDRMSTRPFLSAIEKKFIAFQLLCALNQCHKLEVYHGDIKSENIMVTSWNWVHLADFASFKPTYLPEDNPADFSYFFDTSRRRTCYIAPERFVESSWRNPDKEAASQLEFPTSSDVRKGNLTAAMDIFSAGCVITELFTEGKPPFDLSQLLAYRSGEYVPNEIIHSIDDVYIRDLVKHMMQKDPAQRLSAEEYLRQQKGKAFPDFFYTFLKTFMQRFASPPLLSEDDKICRIHREWNLIINSLNVSDVDFEQNSALVIIISFITSCLRNLQFEKTKLIAMELLVRLSKCVCAEVVLDRIIPFLLYTVNDTFPHVRAEAIRSITKCVVGVKSVPLSDANIFPEYILPEINHLTEDRTIAVRVAFAENIAQLAGTAARFLEIAQLSSLPMSDKTGTTASVVYCNTSYDVELQALHNMIQQKVVTLISDPANVVKQTLVANGITELCVFFGRQKASDVLLSHIITFLNDKGDWHLRAAFFDAVVGIASYIGWQSSDILKPLLQQGLTDCEEFVIHKTLIALQTLVELGLIKKDMKYEFLREVKVLLVHPSLWIRQGAVGYIAALARTMNIADVHCNLLPKIKPYLKNTVIQVSDELVLLDTLVEPLTRGTYNALVRAENIERIVTCLHDRQLTRNNTRLGHSVNYSEVDDVMTHAFRKLQSEGMTVEHENYLLSMEEFICKLHKAKASTDNNTVQKASPPGTIQLDKLSNKSVKRQVDLHNVFDSKPDVTVNPSRKAVGKRKVADPHNMNEDWRFMFGSNIDLEKQQAKQAALQSATGGTVTNADATKASLESANETRSLPPLGTQPVDSSRAGITASLTEVATSYMTDEGFGAVGRTSNTRKIESIHSTGDINNIEHGNPNFHSLPNTNTQSAELNGKYTSCQETLQKLILHKKKVYVGEHQNRDMLDSADWESRPPPAGWRPRGLLVAHLHEHRGAVNRIKVNHDHSYFATCSNDGSVKVYDCSRMEGKSITNRSRLTYKEQEGQIKCLSFCQASNSIASVSDKGESGTIHVFRIERSSAKYSTTDKRELDVKQDGMVVDMTHFDAGSQHVLAYATAYGYLIGWDLRIPGSGKEVWRLQNDPKHGLITSFDVHPSNSWLAVGTSSGTIDCWDLRFQIPVTSVTHPTNARVRRLITHPYEASTVAGAVQGNNEISLWDLETGSRQRTLWASSAPALSLTRASAHSASGLCLAKTDNNVFILAAGSDMRVRYWDLSYPANSQIVIGAATDPPHNTSPVSYRSKLIDGTDVIQEMYGAYRQPTTGEEAPRRGHDLPSTGHHDVITDISICQPSQSFMLTCSRDGVVKVWK